MSRREAIPLEGEFNCWARGFDVPDIVFSVCRREETGLLRFVAPEAEKTLFVRTGQIVFASSSSPDDRLGEYLLKAGRLRLKVLTELSKEVRPGRRLGKLLVGHGVLKEVDLRRAVIEQVEAIVTSLFRWTEGWYGFTAQELPGPETITLEKPTVKLILEGMREIDSWRRILTGVSSLTTAYELAHDQKTIRSLDLDAQALGLLATLRRSQTVEAICASSELHDFEVCRLLWVFRSVGLIRTPASDELPVSDSAAEPVSTTSEDPFALATDTPSPIDATGGLAALPAPPASDYSYTAPKSTAKKVVTDLPFPMAPENFMVESAREVVEDDGAVDMTEIIIDAERGDNPVALGPPPPLDAMEVSIADPVGATLAETDSMLEEDLAFALGHEDYSIPPQFGETETRPSPPPASSSPGPNVESLENAENAPFDPDLDLDLEGLGKVLGSEQR